MNSRELELELLNFEGPVLKAIKTEKGFAIVDQHKVQLTVLDYDRLLKFFRSELSIMDSTGRFWKYSEHSDDAKPSQESNFKELLTIVSSKLKIVNYTTGDLSDLGNEIGITVGTHIKEMTASEISQFISGFRHGVSLTNNTH
jgi:hypothetical protein